MINLNSLQTGSCYEVAWNILILKSEKLAKKIRIFSQPLPSMNKLEIIRNFIAWKKLCLKT